MHTILRSGKKELTIGIDRPLVIIGEKINPTGNKKLAGAPCSITDPIKFGSTIEALREQETQPTQA